MIKSSEEANKYYQLVNQYIDEYVENHKIQPSRLSLYLKKDTKLKRFLERNGLSDIKNINRVINDILEDREAMEKDGVLTFENFKFFESDDFKLLKFEQCLYKGINKANITHEKMLANEFGVSLSNINIIDPERHLFSIDDLNGEKEVLVYSEEEIEVITENIKEFIINSILKKEISVDLPVDINLNIIEFIDEDKLSAFISYKFDAYFCKEVIINFVKCDEFNDEVGLICINPSNLER